VEPQIRPIDKAELETFGRVASIGFGGRFDADHFAEQQEAIELDRSLAAFHDGEMVATAEALQTQVSVPGGADLAASGVKGVVVLPTHRRQGLLTVLMQRQLGDMAERGDALAILWATHPAIYGRFGYGLATFRYSARIDTIHAGFNRFPSGDLTARLVEDPTERRSVSEAVYEARRSAVPGLMRRTEQFWVRRGHDLQGPANFFVRIDDAARAPRGYASYRINREWTDTGPGDHLEVIDAIALDPDTERTLWHYLLGLDLVTQVSAWNRPIDDPLPHLLRDARQLRRFLADGAFLRIVDLPTALSARAYQSEIAINLRVHDDGIRANDATWRLEGSPTGATCVRTAEKAYLELDISTLSSAFLGHPSLGSPAAAGLVDEHRMGALRQAAAAFCWSPAPWAATWF
jgi:predicted acetyltransferase